MTEICVVHTSKNYQAFSHLKINSTVYNFRYPRSAHPQISPLPLRLHGTEMHSLKATHNLFPHKTAGENQKSKKNAYPDFEPHKMKDYTLMMIDKKITECFFKIEVYFCP